MENAIFSVGTFGECLRFVFECVGWRVSPAVFDRKDVALLDKRELHMRAVALDRARLHVAGNAQPFAVRIIAHAAQLADGHVIALALLHTGKCEIPQREQDHSYCGAELRILPGRAGHDYKSLL